MTSLRLRYIHQYRDRHGVLRFYARIPRRKKVTLPGLPGSTEFMAAYQRALADAPAREPIGASRHAHDSVARWVGLYLGSTTFAALAADTQRTRRNILSRFRAEFGDLGATTLRKHNIERMVEAKAHTPSAARNFLNSIRSWLAWCAIEGLRADNPASDVKRAPIKTEGYLTWPEEYVAAYRAHFALGTKPRLAFELLAGTGAARCDIIRMGRQHIRDGVLSFRRKKTGVPVEIPVLPELQAAIDAMPTLAGERSHLTYLVTEYGKPFSDAGFGNWFRERANEAQVPVGYSAHGVRKYAATWHAEHGATAHELMAWFGWLTVREAERYTRAAGRRKLAVGMVRKLTTGTSIG